MDMREFKSSSSCPCIALRIPAGGNEAEKFDEESDQCATGETYFSNLGLRSLPMEIAQSPQLEIIRDSKGDWCVKLREHVTLII